MASFQQGISEHIFFLTFQWAGFKFIYKLLIDEVSILNFNILVYYHFMSYGIFSESYAFLINNSSTLCPCHDGFEAECYGHNIKATLYIFIGQLLIKPGAWNYCVFHISCVLLFFNVKKSFTFFPSLNKTNVNTYTIYIVIINKQIFS